MQPQTFWQKYKVFITGLIGAVFMAIVPLLQPDTNETTTIALLVMAAVTAASSYFARNLRGKAQSIAGILFSVALLILPTLFNHGHLDWKSITSLITTQVATQFFGYSSSPFKPASYEHNEVIVQAKEIPPVNQVPLPPNESSVIKKAE